MIENGAVPILTQLLIFLWTHEPYVPTYANFGENCFLFIAEDSLYKRTSAKIAFCLLPKIRFINELRRKLLRNYSHSIVAGGLEEMS